MEEEKLNESFDDSAIELHAAYIVEEDAETESKPRWTRPPKSTWRRVCDSRPVKFLLLFLPSFITPLFCSSEDQPPKRRTNNITTLDGVRGLSCLFVITHHWTALVVDSYRNPTGFKNSHYFFHLPFVHLLWHGPAQVEVFFVLSGYVLSVKCFKQIHARQWEAFHKTISSSVFRRAIRIFLPPVIALVMWAAAVQLGLFDYARGVFDLQVANRSMALELHEIPPYHYPTVLNETATLWGAVMTLVDPSSPIKFSESWIQYDDHLWTIPTEYYCSMGLYLVVLATSRLRTAWRISLHITLLIYCFYAVHRDPYLFFGGMLIAELDLLWIQWNKSCRSAVAGSLHLPGGNISRRSLFGIPLPAIPVRPITILRFFVLFLGLWILSVPRKAGQETPGYQTLFRLIPAYVPLKTAMDLIGSCGAIMTVWVVSNVSTDTTDDDEDRPWWTTFKGGVVASLTNPVCHYLGKISFALYIVHGFVMKGFGYHIVPNLYMIALPDPARRAAVNGRDPKLTFHEVATIWTLGYLAILPLTIWAADLFTRGVDDKCVALGKWVEEKLLFFPLSEPSDHAHPPRSPTEFDQHASDSRGEQSYVPLAQSEVHELGENLTQRSTPSTPNRAAN